MWKKYNRILRFSLVFSLSQHVLNVLILLFLPLTASPFVLPSFIQRLLINLQQIGMRAHVFGLNKMAPETRSQDVRRMNDSLEAANQRVNGIEVKLHAQSNDLAQLKAMMKEMANQ